MASRIKQFIESRVSRQGKLGRAMIKGVLGTAGIKAAHGAIGFVIAIVLARMLEPSGYGTYTFVMALVSFLAIPSELGIPGLAVREIAVSNARKSWSHMRGFILWAHRAIGVFTLVLVVSGSIILSVWGERLDPVKLKCMWLGLVLVPLVSLGSLRGAMLRGLRKVVLGQLPEQVIRPLLFLALVLLLPLFGNRVDSATGVMSVQIIATAIAFLVGLYLFLKHRPAELGHAGASLEASVWLQSSIPFGLSAALRLINGRTDILALGAFHTDADVGIYRVAVQLAALVVFGLQIVNPIQGPHIAHLYATGDMRRLQQLVTKTSRAILIVTLPVVMLLIMFGGFIIKKAFGAEYATAYVPLIILCAGQLVNASMGSVASILNMTGHERDTAKSIFVGAVVNIALNLTLTPLWGMIGAAVASTCTLIVWNLIMWRTVHARIGIHTSPFYRLD